MKLKLILLIMIAIAATTRAQERPDEVQQAVTNDDGGKAFIVKMFQLSSVVKFGQPLLETSSSTAYFWAAVGLTRICARVSPS